MERLNYCRILVTGGAGFVGSHLVDALVRDGYEVIVIDDLSFGKIENVKHHLNDANFRFIKGDVRDKLAVDESVKDVETVFHLAALTSVPYSIRNPEITYDVNVKGTMNLLRASLCGDVERFIYASTCAVYGEARYLPIDEKHPTDPASPYAESKLAAERFCRKSQEENGLKATILRIFNVYGPRQNTNQYAGVIARFTQRLRCGNPPIIYGDGEQTRDFVYVGDVIQAMILALSNGNSVGRTFNIGTGVPTTINNLAQIIMQIVEGMGVKPQYQGYRQGDIRHSYADISEVKRSLRYEPKFPIEKGLSNLIDEAIGSKNR